MCHLGMSLSLLWWGLQNSDNSRFKCSSQGRRKLRTYGCIHIPGKHMGRRNYRQFCSTHMREKPAANLGLTFIIPPDTHFTLKVARSTYIQGNLTYGSCGSWFGNVWNGTMPQTTNWPWVYVWDAYCFQTESCVYIYIYIYITYSWDGLKSKAPERAILWTSGLCDNPRFRNLMFSYSFETTPNGFKLWFPVCLSYFLIVIHKVGPPSYKLVDKPHCLYYLYS